MIDLKLITDQDAFEEALIKLGQERFLNDLEKAKEKTYYSSTKPGRHFLQTYIQAYINQIDESTELHLTGKRNRGNMSRYAHNIKEFCERLSTEVIAVVALKTITDYFGKNKAMTASNVAVSIGTRIEDELRFNYYEANFEEVDGRAVTQINKKVKRASANPRNRRVASKHQCMAIADAHHIPHWVDWTGKQRGHIGMYLLEVAADLGIIELKNHYNKSTKKNAKMVYADQIIHDIKDDITRIHRGAFCNYPLIDKPKDWEVEEKPARFNVSGGYYKPSLRHKFHMARGYDHDSWFGQTAVDLLNTLQATAWRIDTRVLRTAQALVEKRINVKSLVVPPFDRPADGGAPTHVAEDPVLLEEWKAEMAQMHEIYTDFAKRAVRTNESLRLAEEYVHRTFYLSWSMDYRSRYYSQQAWLQPQATDMEKSLIKFQKGCRLNKDSLRVCKEAIGAAFNGSRISFQDRIKWTEDNTDLIRQIAEDPVGTVPQWENAKEPWQFLQLCFEYYDVELTKSQIFWKVPVGADATASGLQLLSGMRRDPKGMKFANLLEPETPDSPPEDAYMEVLRISKQIANGEVPIVIKKKPVNLDRADLIKYLNWRSLGKPALMVSLYNGSFKTIREKIVEALKDEGVEINWEKDQYTRYNTEYQIHYQDTAELTRIVLAASKTVFPMAFEALTWLQKVFKQAVEANPRNVKWTVPTGDLIHVLELDPGTEPVYTKHFGKVMLAKNLTFDLDGNCTSPTDDDSIVSAAIPGFVHSYDAALVKEAFKGWDKPLALVHDCLKCLPEDMAAAIDEIRDAFTTIVREDPLAKLADDLGVTEEMLPRLQPGTGSLDSVERSRYMFN